MSYITYTMRKSANLFSLKLITYTNNSYHYICPYLLVM